MDPRYVDRGGELSWQQPYSALGVQFFGFIVPAGLEQLRAIADRYLNLPLQQPGRFVPAAHHAMIVFNSIDRLQSERTPRWGWTTEQEMAVWLLLADTCTRRLVWFHPYMLVDNDAAMVSGREVYGFPKALGWFEIPRGPQPPERLSVQTMLVRRFGDDSQRKRETLLTARRVDGAADGERVSSLRELIRGATARLKLDFELLTEFDLAGEATHALLTADVPMVFLKQVRSAADPECACYQCVQQVDARAVALHDARLYVGQRFELQLTDADSHPIRRDLGLAAGPIEVALGFWINFDLSIGNCTQLGDGVALHGAPKQRIAILGGGVGAITTAFELTNEPDWKDRYDVTIYQLGHRLGGKGASGRGPHGRIEEHGLHVWLGFYDNAFRIIRQAYAELTPGGDAPSRPDIVDGVFASWERAFRKHSLIGIYDRDGTGQVTPWLFRFPDNGATPGDPTDECSIWSMIAQIVEWMTGAARRDTTSQLWRSPPSPAHVSLFTRIERIGSDLSLALDVVGRSAGLAALETLLALLERMPQGFGLQTGVFEQALVSLLHTLQEWIVDESARAEQWQARLLLIFDLAAALVRGLVIDRIVDGRDLGALDEDFRSWLRRHGAREQTVDLRHNAPLRALYDFVFAFVGGEPKDDHASFEAGAAIRTILRMLLTYRGAIFWKMNAGMGDTIFTPLYKLLKRRGVRFEFFSKVERLNLSADGSRVDSIEITRQATPLSGEYEPLVRVNALDCWPAAPRYEQLREGDQLQAQGADLESFWCTWPGADKRVLHFGAPGPNGFDRVVYGLSLGSVPFTCQALVERMGTWREMVQHVRTVQTMGVQLWLEPDLSQLGWEHGSAVTTSFVEPLDTWADMSHLIAREGFPRAPGSIAYFCGPLGGPEPDPNDPSTPLRARAAVEAALQRLLVELSALWPKAYTGSGTQRPSFDPGLLVDRYLRANIDPSERYVMSVAGSSRYRLRADRSGVDNLVLTGDWIDNGFNAGCVEAAVLGGIQAANALRGRPRMHGVVGRDLL